MIDAIATRAPGFKPRVAVILGSGLGTFAEEVEAVATIPYGDLPDFPHWVARRCCSPMPREACGSTCRRVR